MKEIRNVDHVVVISDGKVSSAGTHDELYGNDEVYTTFCDLLCRGYPIHVSSGSSSGDRSRR